MKRNARDFLYSLVDYEKRVGYDYDLDAYRRFLERIGAPQKKLPNVVLIAGTKGKGSTAAILASCLMQSGLRVGLYTSPHLSEINERIRVDGALISDEDLERLIAVLRPLIERKGGARSFFEAITTVAFLYFLEQHVDCTVLEVGLGGRLDATNVSDPVVSVITRIGYDHTNLLGKTLEQITREKAGIIRQGGNLVTLHQRPSVDAVLKRIAAEKKSRVSFADQEHIVTVLDRSLKGSRVRIRGTIGNVETLLPLAGAHQIENLSIATAALVELRRMGLPVTEKSVRTGIENTRLRGRFEVVSDDPLIIFDCAHNGDSFRALEYNIGQLKIRDFEIIFGASREKDIRYFLKHISPRAKHVSLVKADHPRAAEPRDLLKKVRRYQKNATVERSVSAALDRLSRAERKPAAIIVTGSFYLWQKEWGV